MGLMTHTPRHCQPILVAGIGQTDHRELARCITWPLSPGHMSSVKWQCSHKQISPISDRPHLGNGHGPVTRLGLGSQSPGCHNSGQYLFITGQFYHVSAHCSHPCSLSHLNTGQVCAELCPLPLSLALTTDQVSLSAHFSGSPALHMSTSLSSKHFVTLYHGEC